MSKESKLSPLLKKHVVFLNSAYKRIIILTSADILREPTILWLELDKGWWEESGIVQLEH